MKNEKEFYLKIEEVMKELIEIGPIKKRSETSFLIFRKKKIIFAVGGDDKEDLGNDLDPFFDRVQKIVEKTIKVYDNSYEEGDVEITLNLKDYINKAPAITVEEVREFFYKNDLVMLMDRFEDKEFCMEVLNAKFPDNKDEGVNKIFTYFNS